MNLSLELGCCLFQKVMHINTCRPSHFTYVSKMNCLKVSLGLGWCIANTYSTYSTCYIQNRSGEFNLQYLKVSMVLNDYKCRKNLCA